MMRATLMSLLLVLAGCAGSDSFGNTPDAGGLSDAGAPGCDLFLLLPNGATVGQEVEVEVSVNSALFGARNINWTVKHSGIDQSFTELSSPADRISFVPSLAGSYQVVVQGSIGSFACVPDSGDINVNPPGAVGQNYRLRIIPRGNTPKVDYPITVLGGANAVLPTISVEAGMNASGTILSQGGLPVPAYLRARRVGTQSPIDYESFADAQGQFSLRLPVGLFDLSIVPSDPSLPSALFPGLSNAQIATTLSLPTLQSYSGHIFDALGNPMPGARVSLVANGAASTASTSSLDGSFSVSAFGALLTGVRVAPPAGSGLPTLVTDFALGQTLIASSDVVIRFSDTVTTASVDATLSSGAVAAMAQVHWRASLPAAGTVEVTSVETVSGELSVQALADQNGHAETPLVARSADVVAIAGNGEALVRISVPWDSSPVQIMELKAPVLIPIFVSEAGNPRADVRVSATPVSVLVELGTTTSGTTSALGMLSLPLVTGASYLIEGTLSGGASVVSRISSVLAGAAVHPIVLPNTLAISGRLAISGASSGGAQIGLYCVDCDGEEDKSRALASAVSDEAGNFVLRVIDPGVISE